MSQDNKFPKITGKELDRLKKLLGLDIDLKDPFNRYATPDTIRHFVHGFGDTNPLFTDEEYGTATRWGSIVAPPTFLFSCFGRGAPQGLRGIHSMWAGAHFTMRSSITSGTEIRGTVALTKLEEKISRFASKTIHQEHTYTFTNIDKEMIGKVREWHIRTERDTARIRGQHNLLEPAHYTRDDIARIFADYEREEVRGDTPRYWEDVTKGEDIPQVVKGPLRVTDNVAWKIGWGFRPFTYAHGIGIEYYKRHPMAYITNEQGIPDVPEIVHWDKQFARRIGVPYSYDFGPQRLSWLGQVVTNWMGDEGIIREIWGEVRRFNLVGDVHWLKGKVLSKKMAGNQHVVELLLTGNDQRDEETIRGGAIVSLPIRK